MHEGRLILAQLIKFIPKRNFDNSVKRHHSCLKHVDTLWSMMVWIAHTTAANAVSVVGYGPEKFPYYFWRRHSCNLALCCRAWSCPRVKRSDRFGDERRAVVAADVLRNATDPAWTYHDIFLAAAEALNLPIAGGPNYAERLETIRRDNRLGGSIR